MEWKDKGLIIGVRRHGENSLIVEMMTENHGRHMGLVRSGRSTTMRAVLQPGNSCQIVWRARLEEHLGLFQIEAEELRAAKLMAWPLGIYGLQTLAGHLRLLPERDPHKGLYHASNVLLDHLGEAERAARLLMRFELQLLEELGFGLDLSSCAATGMRDELIYVSPKSGRAVSRAGGEPYKDRLFSLPWFLLPKQLRPEEPDSNQADYGQQALDDGFKLIFHFFNRHVYGPRGIKPPVERDGFISRVKKALDADHI